MRALIVVFVAVSALLVVRCMLPGASEAADREDQAKAEETAISSAPASEARFLAPPVEPEPQHPSVAAAPPAQAPAPAAPPAPEPVPERPAWLADVRPQAQADPNELGIAAALVHGEDIARAAGGRSSWRAQLAESFAAALAGDPDRALAIAEKLPEDVGAAERALLQAVLTGKTPVAAGKGPKSALVLAMETALLAREAEQSLEGRDYRRAASAYSELLQREISAPWEPDSGTLRAWSAALEKAQEKHRWDPKGDWEGVELRVEPGDSLIAVRKRFLAERPGALMCTGLIERANSVNGFLQPGQVLRIPTDPVRVVVDLSACWALYFAGDEVAAAWPVGVGRAGEETPTGEFHAGDKLENPPWMKTGQPMVPFGDPANPLGTRWIGWFQGGAKTSYGFHGTTDPESIGQPSSDGCVRLHNADVEELFRILPEGASILVRE